VGFRTSHIQSFFTIAPMAVPPVDGPFDMTERRIYEWEDALQSLPAAQFARQIWRERGRLRYQRANRQAGRKQTLPYNDSLDLGTNAQNNVRYRWKEQGIWSNSWGKDPNSPALAGISPPVAAWMHEGEKRPGTSASRPLRQFNYQVSKELEWLTDEKAFRESQKQAIGVEPIARMAHDRIKALWIKDKIWDLKWPDIPGIKWRHENFNIQPSPPMGGKARAKRKREISLSSEERVAVPPRRNRRRSIQFHSVFDERNVRRPRLVDLSVIDIAIPAELPKEETERRKPAEGVDGDRKHRDRNRAMTKGRTTSECRHNADRELVQAFLVQTQVEHRRRQAEGTSHRPKRRVGGMRMVFREMMNLYRTRPTDGSRFQRGTRRRMVQVF
jgi:hypothetical protein